MDNSDDSIRLNLELGFQQDHHLTNISEPEKKKNNNTFSFLSLALSEAEPRSDQDDHATGAVRDDNIIKDLNKGKTVVAAGAAASSVTAVTSWTAAMSDEDEDCNNTPRKKLRLSKHQISVLENTFQLHPTLNPKDKNDLATQLNLRPRQVEVWFQNRRARIKMKQTEVDRESLKKCCEILKEENRRLQKEVTELKSLKLQAGTPFQFQVNNIQSSSSPMTPTMCPSCEGTGRTTRSSSLNPNYNINGDAGSPTRSFFSSSIDSSNTPKTRVCEN